VTPEPGAARRAVRGLVLAVALFAAVVVQLTVVNRLPLPGAGEPDLVLLLVTAIAVATGPAAGAVSGFAGGLALDVAPPSAHYAGEYALVFCLAGYAAARAARVVWERSGEQDPVISFTIMAVAAAAGEAGKGALGLLLSDPEVTGAAISRVLPDAVLYDLVLAPVVFWLVARVTRAAAAERAPAPEFGYAQRLASGFRQASAGDVPNLRLAGSGERHHGPSPARPVPRLRLAGSRSPAIARTSAAGSGGAPLDLTAARTPKLSFAGERPAATPARQPHGPGKHWLRAAGAAPAKRSAAISSPKLGSSPKLSFSGDRPAGTPVRQPHGPGKHWLDAAGAVPSQRPGALGAATGLRRSPRRGWLGGATAGRGTGSGMRSGSGMSSKAFRRTGTARRTGYTASPSRGWLRRSRHPWRRRSQRLLRLVGVGR
jgi:rod shape-determining protein MreD